MAAVHVYLNVMRILNWNRLKAIVRGYKMGDYLRQFSIVVGGIIVTFWGSDLIAEHARQKEVRSTMQLVAEELQHSREALEDVRNLADKDVRMSTLLKENELNVSAVSRDSLYKYRMLFSNMTTFNYSTDALEVLKGSSLMQYISDKRMLQDVLQTYHKLSRIKGDITTYYSMKSKILYDIVFIKSEKDNISYSKSEDPLYENASYLMRQKSFSNFVRNVPDIIDWKQLAELDKQLEDQIRVLEEKYGSSSN